MTEKILIVGPAWVGDMVMAQALFHLLIAKNKDVVIDVLAPPWSGALLERMPQVNEAIMMPMGHGQLKLRARYRLAKAIQKRGYDQAILLPNSFKSALIPFLARIPNRRGWLGEFRYLLLNDIRHLLEDELPMMVQRFVALAAKRGEAFPQQWPLPRLEVDPVLREQALSTFQLTTEKPVLAICPGAEFGSAKRWLPEYYAELAEYYQLAGWQVWCFGSPKDQSVASEVLAHCKAPITNLVGKTNLAEAIDLLSVATVVVSNDSGLMHIASSLHKPVVAIYGSTPPEFAPPLTEKARTLFLDLSCSPCRERHCPLKHHNCMRELTPQRVIAAIRELTGEQHVLSTTSA